IKMRFAFVILALMGAPSVKQANKITNELDDYINFNRKRYVKKLVKFEADIENARNLFKSRLEAILVQGEQLMLRLDNISAIKPPQNDNAWKTHCFETYRKFLPQREQVSEKLKNCTTKANEDFEESLENCRTFYNTIKSYYPLMDKMLDDCILGNTDSLQQYFACAKNAINKANAVTLKNQNKFYMNLQMAIASSDAIVSASLGCSFAVTYGTCASLGAIHSLIAKCLANKENCSDSSCKKVCEFQMIVPAQKAAFNDTNIKNPFYYTGKQSCILVYFK
ncbi:hypothetical protein KR222_002079, partial [Zaprionus bogoriensis]